MPGGGERAVGRHLATVRRVDDDLEAHIHRPVTSEEIAAALAVSDRTLRAAFGAVHGISLHTYLRLRRLDRVRARLPRTHPALAASRLRRFPHGFWHLGRFTAACHARWGENPSQTLPDRRGRGVAARQLRDRPCGSPRSGTARESCKRRTSPPRHGRRGKATPQAERRMSQI